MQSKYTFIGSPILLVCHNKFMNYNWYYISLLNITWIIPFLFLYAKCRTCNVIDEIRAPDSHWLGPFLLDHKGKNIRFSGSYAATITATNAHNIRMLITPVLTIWSKFPCKWLSNSYSCDCKIGSFPRIPSVINSLFTVSFVSSRCTSWKSTFEHFVQEHLPPRYLGSVCRYSDRTFSYVVSPSIFNFFRVTGFKI